MPNDIPQTAIKEERVRPDHLSTQLVGAYGERVVEAELLRRGWVASNINASVKNSADFDIFAFRHGRSVHIRVKTCGPDQDAFQYSGRLVEADPAKLTETDFAVLVRMGWSRREDQFYVMPTRALLETILAHKDRYLQTMRRDGGARKDLGHWTLHLGAMRSGEDRVNYDLATKWRRHLDNWEVLDVLK